MDGEFRTKAEEKAHLAKIVQEWNDSRLDMFALSMPDKDLEFHGVMRFYFQDAGLKVVTKCIRVSSKTTVGELMDTLIEKFCPDMKMLTPTNYELFEVHEKGDTRKLGKSERPLLVQLSWHRDDREGRFILKSASIKVSTTFYEIGKDEGQLRRRLSRREKKELKKRRKQEAQQPKEPKGQDDAAIAQQLYNELPETSLTRSISNPEAVMKRRRQQKLQQRLQEFQKNDGQQTGGTLKIFAETLKPEVPYKTILASVRETSDNIVKDALEKFQLENENPIDFCLVMAMIPPGENPGPSKERAVRDDDCPLAIQSSWPSSRGFLTFHLRKKNTVSGFKKDKAGKQKTPEAKADMKAAARLAQNEAEAAKVVPILTEILPEGVQGTYKARVLKIQPNVTIVGSSKTPVSEQYFQLYASDISHEHCVIANMEGVVTITPSTAEALVLIDGRRIRETALLRNGSVVYFGNALMFEFNSGKDGPPAGAREPPNVSPARVKSPANERQPQSPTGREERPPYSPTTKEKVLNALPGSKVDDELVVETTFGVDGEIASSPVRKTDPKGGFTKSASNLHDAEMDDERRMFNEQFGHSAPDLAGIGDKLSPDQGPMEQGMQLLPASLEFIDDAQDAFFAAIISEVNGAAVHFKLAPSYSLYLACHYMISTDYRPELGGVEHARVVGSTTRKMAIAMEKTVQENDTLAGSLGFWMANASEFLHFLKQDLELSPLTQNAQGILAQTVQHAFRLLVLAMEDELVLAMPAFLDPSESADIPEYELDSILDDELLERADSTDLLNWTSDERTFPVHDGRPISGDHWVTPAARIRHHGQPVMADVLYILSSAMSLLRRCRVNAALTIQLFSQLFHYINMWLFNKLVLEPQLGLCTRAWGRRLRRRLGYVEAWAEKQGLELAADCHLCRIVQAAHLLDAPKLSAEDIASISSTCFKLNSLQLRALLKMYRPDRGEHVIPPELIDSVAAVAEHTADELARSDGREVRLDEDIELQLPFLLPEDGYSCDIIRGVPAGLQEFLELLIDTGICRLTVNPASMGTWTIHQEQYMEDDEVRPYPVDDQYPDQPYEDEDKPDIIEVTLNKGNKGLGLSIVAAKGPNTQYLGIYIKGVVDGGTAFQNGMLEPGDQIVSVNGQSLVDVSQEVAAKLMGQAGSTVVLQISKQAAVYHGLAALLSQPSPATSPPPQSRIEKAETEELVESAPTINEQSPQIRTQRWIANHGGPYDDDKDLEQAALEEERRRREEEEYYQAEENRRMEEEREGLERVRREEEENERLVMLQREEEQRQEEERRLEELRRIEAQRKREEEQQLAEQREKERIEKERAEQQRRLDEARRRQELERAEAEQRRLEEERMEQERMEQERLQQQREEEDSQLQEEERKMAEEQRKFEQRQREYEERLRIMEEQHQKRLQLEARMQEEARLQEEVKLRKEEEERAAEQRRKEDLERREADRIRLEQERKRKEEERRIKEAEEKRRNEERKRMEDDRRRMEEERKRKDEERRRHDQERRRQEEERKFQEAERLRREEEDRAYSMAQEHGIPDNLDDPDFLPPPPEDLLFGDENSREQEDQLEQRIQNQLAAERIEHEEIKRQQLELQQSSLYNYEETNIDDVDDAALERRLVHERALAQSLGLKSNSFYSSDEDPNDIEAEFQRRLQQENERQAKERRLGYEPEFERLRLEREKRAEQELKLQLMINDHQTRRAATRSTSDDIVDEQQKRMQKMSVSGQKQTKPTEDDWFALQRQQRLEQKQEQERSRKEQREADERERQRKVNEVKAQREQEQKIMAEYQRQKELDQRRGNERFQQKEEEQRGARDRYNQGGNQVTNHKEIVKDEFKEKAFADYERRRATLDKEVERAEREKRIRSMAPPVAKKPFKTPSQEDDDDEPPPPRPPPPSAVSPASIVRSSTSSSPSPQSAGSGRFSFSQKTISNVNSQGHARSATVSPPSRIYSQTNQFQARSASASASNSRSPSREDPAALGFQQKMKMFGLPQKTATGNDMRSTFSKKQREYMD